MSFETMNHDQLLEAAEMFAVDLNTSLNTKGKVNPKLAAAAFAEEGVTHTMYVDLKAQYEAAHAAAAAEEAAKAAQEAQNAANVIKADSFDDEDEVEPIEDEVIIRRRRKPSTPTDILVKMDRQNPHYEVQGKVFTREHPFVLMSPEAAQRIFDAETGFRVATPREAAEYYS